MANFLKEYSSADVKVVFGGYTFSGLASDFLSEEPSTDITDTEVGADGSLSPSFMPDRTSVVTLNLQQQSLGNNFLSALKRKQDEDSKLIVSPLTVLDPSGSMVVSYTQAYLQGKPSVSRGSTATGSTMSWSFRVGEVKYGLGTQAEQVTEAIASIV